MVALSSGFMLVVNLLKVSNTNSVFCLEGVVSVLGWGRAVICFGFAALLGLVVTLSTVASFGLVVIFGCLLSLNLKYLVQKVVLQF